jgi:hypothetical protein
MARAANRNRAAPDGQALISRWPGHQIS